MIEQAEIAALLGEIKSSQKVLTAIGDETRQYLILQMLTCNHCGKTRCGGMRVGEIAALTSLSRPAVSHHLRIFKDAGLLKMRREGTRNFYYFDADVRALQNLIDMLEHVKRIMTILPDRSGEDDTDSYLSHRQCAGG